jgi:hypothetical protein
MPTDLRKSFRPWAVCAAVLLAAALRLRAQGRSWLCECGYFLLWTGDTWSADNSQHLFDPYALTHVLHGFLFCGLLALIAPGLDARWRLCLAVAAEALWEVVENTEFVVNRYRETTAALGYRGDTVINSLGDVAACAVGFVIALRLGWRRALLVFVAVEASLLFWIKDGLLLNIIMLLYPSDAIRQWQAAGR